MFNGQECKILWLGKRDALRPLVDSYAMGLPSTFKENCCSQKTIQLLWGKMDTNVHIFHCMLLSLALLLLAEKVMFRSSCYAPCDLLCWFFMVHPQCIVVTYIGIPLPIFTILACYYHLWYSFVMISNIYVGGCPHIFLLFILFPSFFNVNLLWCTFHILLL